jgi:DNA-binding NarL/FixJ family response regulator
MVRHEPWQQNHFKIINPSYYKTMKKILLVEETSVIAVGILHILEELGFTENSVEVVKTFDEMTSLLERNGYALVLFGLKNFHNKNGSALIDVVQAKKENCFLVFCEQMDIADQRKMYRAGVKGILYKNSSKKEIAFAMQKVLDNDTYIDIELAIKLFLFEKNTNNANHILTQREKQVAELLAQGKKNTHIGSTLKMMPSTVSTFKTRIFNKLNIRNIIELKELENFQKIF